MKPSINRTAKLIFLVLLASALITGLTWQNYQFCQRNAGGIDFLTHWVAARSALDGNSPYTIASATGMQMLFYGRPATPGENAFYVLYPIHYLVFILPFGLVPDPLLARSLWMTFAEILLVITAIASASAVKWRIPTWVLPLYLVFSLFWYHGLRTLINGNLVILVALALALTAWAVSSRHDWLAGLALVFVTIKPNLGLLPVLWVLTWAISQRRWKIILSFCLILTGFSLLGLVFFPSWPADMLKLMLTYTGYNPPTNPGMVIDLAWPGSGKWVGMIFTIGVTIILLYEGTRNIINKQVDPLWMLCLVIVLSQWSGITTDPGNFIVLFLPITLVLKRMSDLPAAKWSVPLTLAVLLAGSWILFLSTVQVDAFNQPIQSPWLFFPLIFLLVVGLYLTRREIH